MSGVFVFDSWLRKVRQKLNPFGIKIPMQYHDELMTVFLPEYKDYVSLTLKESMNEVNKQAEMYIYDEFGVIYYSWTKEVFVENVEIYWEARGKPQNLENEKLRKDENSEGNS